jgi:hypothetical protein
LFRFLCDDSQHHVFSLDAPFQMLSAHYLSTHLCFFPYMSTLVRGHGPRGYSFWRFQPPDALYMLSRLFRKVNPFRSDLLLLLHPRPKCNYTAAILLVHGSAGSKAFFFCVDVSFPSLMVVSCYTLLS